MKKLNCGKCGKECDIASVYVCNECGTFLCEECKNHAGDVCPDCYGFFNRLS